MRKVSIVFLLFAFCFTGRPIRSQVGDEKLSVSVEVSCDDQITKGKIESFLKRELRSLGDVTIQDTFTADYSLELVVLEMSYVSTGNKTGGIAVSSVFIKNYSLRKILDYYVPFALVIDSDEILAKMLNEDAPPYRYRHFVSNLLLYNKTENLSNICEGIVASFDTRVLEKERQRR